MKRAIVIQHVEMEGPERIGELCRERGLAVEVLQVHAGDPVPARVASEEMLIVMGGGMGVGDLGDARYPFLRREVELIKAALDDDRPVLGVCLGAQLLAHAAGARVYPNVIAGPQARRVLEVGWGPVTFQRLHQEPVLSGLAPEEMVLHWHGDTFDLPPAAVLLASTAACARQAFRLGRHSFGLQFHVEAGAATARRWAVEDADFVRAARGPDGVAQVLAETEIHAARARAAGDRLIRNILGCMTA